VEKNNMKARIKNKIRKNTMIIMDVNALPENMDGPEWHDLIIHNGIITWDSNKGEQPIVYPTKNKKVFNFVRK
jgi:hypothetical protein